MSIWKANPELERRILELVEDGTFRESGEEGVREILISEFPGLESQLTLRSVKSKLAHIIWSNRLNQERFERLLKQDRVNGADIKALFPLVPERWIRAKIQRAKEGDGKAGSLQRVGTLITSPEELRLGLQLPVTSLQNPLPVEIRDPRTLSIMAINAPQVGLIYRGDLATNVFRNALTLAQAKSCDAVIITGNIIHLDLMRASRNKPYRSEISGMRTEPGVLEQMGGYDSADDVERLLQRDGLVFITLRERFETLLKGIKKIFTDDGNLIFKGEVLITFGLNEEELIHYAVNEELRARVAIEGLRLQWQIQTLLKELRKERKSKHHSARAGELEKRIEKLTIRLKRTNMTNVSDEVIRKMRDRIGAWVIKRITEIIPNSKVVGIDEVFLGAGEKIVQILQNPTNRTTDTYLGSLITDLRKETRRSDLADLILLGGKSVLTRASIPIRYYSRTRGSVTADLEQLPMLLDREFLIEIGRRMVKEGTPLLKLLSNEHFYAGVNIYKWVDGVLRKEFYSSKFLSQSTNFTNGSLKELIQGANMLYGLREGDKHGGHPWVTLYPTNGWPHWLRHDEVCLTLLERLKAPILWYIDLGDIVQGHNFPTELENHPDWMRPDELQKRLKALRTVKRRASKVEKMVLNDKVRSGIVRVEDQLQEYLERFVVPRFVPFAARIILRARGAGFVTQGTLGILNLLSGNHFMNTFEGELAESTWVRMRLVTELYAYALENGLPLSRQEIENVIKAPMFGKEALVEGSFGIQHGPEAPLPYAVNARHKPVGAAVKYADPIRRAREAFGKRGATTQALTGLWTLVMAGHTHMGGSSSTPYGDYLECGSQTDSDPYGERLAYPLNVISSVVMGVHADGPERGPRVEISLRDDLLRAYAREPWPIDAKKLFANAIGWDDEEE